ncbi:MAG: acetyl-CoA carboxylase, biotin carboxyl carrier protein [Omnitrophica bacterium RIFCSPHIGHO2_02_FULL_51_18]|nr:MAG: acetyl-CoA carboxylase, biotin carboxyl carrier protein [Omnitrophica bacterium RIFCSPHIGHO2_02_FULL_51_18]
MNIKEIKEMIQLMNENNLTELEMEEDGVKIRLKKNAAGFIEPSVVTQMHPVPGASLSAREKAQNLEAATPPAPAPKSLIKSPMVGTFYASPAPDAPSFVQAGSPVEVGQVVCIIEAMKLMNEIKSEIRGRVVEILVNNGSPVEFGQPLFSLE